MIINQELEHLTHLLNDLYEQNCDYFDEPTDFDVVLLSCELIALIRPYIPAKITLEVKSALSFVVRLPESKLRLVLLNLMLNAIAVLIDKASGHICIYFSKDEDNLLIQVWDDGPGFPPVMLELTVFTKEHHSKSTCGLATVQQFITMMEGQIYLSNHLPHGACVSMFLPLDCVVAIQ